MIKRVFLFAITNIAVLALLAIILNVFGLDRAVTQYGINWVSLIVIAAVFGFGGSFISLLISRTVAKWATGAKVIQPGSSMGERERWVLETTHSLAQRAGMKSMPEVAIYESEEVNAFATGPSQKRSLVAVSSGLLNAMSRDEAEGVIAHEVSHIVNGDMVTMTLLQGVINTFVIFLSRVLGWVASRFVREELGWITYYIVSFILQILLSILGMMVVMAYSRRREFFADAGAATLAGKGKMIGALERLKDASSLVDSNHKALATMKINGSKGWLSLFSSHPPLEDRIARLQQNA